MTRRPTWLCVLGLLALAACSGDPATESASASDAGTSGSPDATNAGVAGRTGNGGAGAAGVSKPSESRTGDGGDGSSPRSTVSDAAQELADADGGAAETGKPCAALAPFDVPHSISVGATSREYLVHVPKGAGPLPLVIDFHGLLTHAEYERASSGFAGVADAEGFIVAYPEAIDSAWSLGADTCCAVDTSVDDLAFARALVSELQKSGCIDGKRVYAVGVSAGGGLAQQLACRASDLFAAAASRDFDLLSNDASACKPARPIAVLSLRDMTESSFPYAGGELRPMNGLPARFESLGAAASFARWAAIDQCEGEPDAAGADCRVYAKCAAGVQVQLCNRRASDATADATTAWEFLRRFQLP